jgi:fatty acid-binding protein DegV
MTEAVGTTQPVNLAVVHAEAPDEGQQLLARAESLFNCRVTFVTDLTTSLVVHFGPKTLGLIAYQP